MVFLFIAPDGNAPFRTKDVDERAVAAGRTRPVSLEPSHPLSQVCAASLQVEAAERATTRALSRALGAAQLFELTRSNDAREIWPRSEACTTTAQLRRLRVSGAGRFARCTTKGHPRRHDARHQLSCGCDVWINTKHRCTSDQTEVCDSDHCIEIKNPPHAPGCRDQLSPWE